MTLEVKQHSDIYQRISEELEQIIQSLQSQSSDKALDEAQADALEQLRQHQADLREQLAKLKENSEWNTFTIAFYGETGAGKSSIIETLRILLREPSKLANQQAFHTLQEKYGLSVSSFQKLALEIEQNDNQLAEISQQLTSTKQSHDQQLLDALKHIKDLQNFITEHKRTASIWQKILLWFRKLPGELELATAEQKLPEIVTAQEKAIGKLFSQQTEAERYKKNLVNQSQERESHLSELDTLADGAIIGDGSSDFTRKTQRYDFELDGQKFALLDVPGIEGKEGLVLKEIEHAVQTAHAVFYVTNQAAPPQTGDEQRQGTLEKIKTHLAAQTEVWALFNKKIVNPMALQTQTLIKDDEQISLAGLNEKMREHLGNHYREVFTLSALPAFLASTDHLAPNSQNAKRRNKFLASFGSDELLESSRIRAFIQLLSEQLLSNSDTRIKAANFNQAKSKVDESNDKIRHIHQTFTELADQLELNGNSSCKQLWQSFNMLKQRLDALSGKLIDEWVSAVRRPIYKLIEQDIGNDTFKSNLISYIEQQQEKFSAKLPKAIQAEVKVFQQDAEDILKRFEEYSQELASIYGKLGRSKLNCDFEIKIKIDNGINVWGLLGGLAGLAAAPFTGGASLWLVAAGLLSAVVGVGKALWGAFNSSYKKAQQRKATEENLRGIGTQLQTAVRAALDETLPQIQKTIEQLEQALKTPSQQTAAKVQLLKRSTQQLDLLSRQISNAGNLT